jgi:7-cyano-7-deazaguanine synthase
VNGDPAVILLSGGLDSATVLAIARSEGYRCFALSIDYGQRHRSELEAARRVARSIGVEDHVIMSIDLRAFGGSALTDDAIEVPKNALNSDDAGTGDGPARQRAIPPTYVPARNTVFLAIALAYAETIGAFHIFLGANAIDYSGYPDCRPEFITAFERVANLGTKAGVGGTGLRPVRDRGPFHIHAPLIDMTKAQIIQRGVELGVDYSLTHSCYDPDPDSGGACGRCDSCILRRRGFEEAGIEDPTMYSTAGAR